MSWVTYLVAVFIKPDEQRVFVVLLKDEEDWIGKLASPSQCGRGANRTGALGTTTRSSGRYTQIDPIGMRGGLNLYGYANSDPVNFKDPSGLSPECEWPRDFQTGVCAIVLPGVGTDADASSWDNVRLDLETAYCGTGAYRFMGECTRYGVFATSGPRAHMVTRGGLLGRLGRVASDAISSDIGQCTLAASAFGLAAGFDLALISTGWGVGASLLRLGGTTISAAVAQSVRAGSSQALARASATYGRLSVGTVAAAGQDAAVGQAQAAAASAASGQNFLIPFSGYGARFDAVATACG